jgi:SAM-dependent methyltransferase
MIPRRGTYGVDAPIVPVTFAVALVFVAVNAVIARNVWMLIPGLFLIACGATYLHSTKRGKFLVWAELLDGLKLHGDERILDMGCGRGAVLLMAAQHLSTGKAVGVDIWQSRDQSGNAMDATQANAVAEGVADRVELHTADMRELPFPDAGFDVIVSSLAIHNIPATAGREKAIDEAVRVLKPGGRLLIADIKGTRNHEERLIKLGMTNIGRRRLGWRLWWGGPWGATRLVTATKPQTVGDPSTDIPPH